MELEKKGISIYIKWKDTDKKNPSCTLHLVAYVRLLCVLQQADIKIKIKIKINQSHHQQTIRVEEKSSTSRRKTPFSLLPLFFLFLSTQTIVYFTDFSFLDSRVTFFFNKLEREREREIFFFTFFFLCELGESTQWNMFFSGDPSTRKRVDLGGRSSKERDRQKLLEQTRLERNRRLWLRQQNSAALKIQVRIFCFLLLLAIFKFRVSVLFAN